MPRKPASETVICLCRLLNILANFTNLFLHTGKHVDPDQTAPRGAVWSGSTLFAKMTFNITSRWQSRHRQLLWLAVYGLTLLFVELNYLPHISWILEEKKNIGSQTEQKTAYSKRTCFFMTELISVWMHRTIKFNSLHFTYGHIFITSLSKGPVITIIYKSCIM